MAKKQAKSICYLNGRYQDVADASIAATDRGFLFGEGLFETWRTYKGRPFALKEHLRRMSLSAKQLGIPFDSKANWEGRTKKLAKLNGLDATGGAVRLTITRGPGPVSLIPQGKPRPTQLMLFRPLEPNLVEARRDGVTIHLMNFGSGVHQQLRQLKTVNYVSAVIGKTEAKKRNCFESLYRLNDASVLEGTTSNYFIVDGGHLYTPPVHDGVLPGVTRGITLKIAKRILPVHEKTLTVPDLMGADEIFITSSTIEIVPVTKIDRRRVHRGDIGEITRELQGRYRRYVSREIGLPADELDD